LSFVYRGLFVLIADLLALNFVPMPERVQGGLIVAGGFLLAMVLIYWTFEGDGSDCP
jgi:hypothetical protein